MHKKCSVQTIKPSTSHTRDNNISSDTLHRKRDSAIRERFSYGTLVKEVHTRSYTQPRALIASSHMVQVIVTRYCVTERWMWFHFEGALALLPSIGVAHAYLLYSGYDSGTDDTESYFDSAVIEVNDFGERLKCSLCVWLILMSDSWFSV